MEDLNYDANMTRDIPAKIQDLFLDAEDRSIGGLATDGLQTHHVECFGSCLYFFNFPDGSKRIPPGRELLADFISLADGTESDFYRFARKYGHLDLCLHGALFGHRKRRGGICEQPKYILPGRFAQLDAYAETRCQTRRLALKMFKDPPNEQGWHSLGWTVERIEDWRYFSLKARAFLNIAACIRSKRPSSGDDWRIICSRNDSLGEHDHVSTLIDCGPNKDLRPFVEREEVARLLDVWIQLTGVRPILSWLLSYNEGPHPDLILGTVRANRLGAAIALQLASAIAEAHFICANCHQMFRPSRLRTRGERSFCDACREAGAARKFASRDLRARRKTAKPGTRTVRNLPTPALK